MTNQNNEFNQLKENNNNPNEFQINNDFNPNFLSILKDNELQFSLKNIFEQNLTGNEGYLANLNYLGEANNEEDINNFNNKSRIEFEKGEGFLNNKISNEKIKKTKIFNITKIHKLGRPKKFSIKNGKHSRFSQDNVIRKFKALLIKNIYLYINSLFKLNNYGKSKHQINIIKKIVPSHVKSASKHDNLTFLDSKLKNVFSENISDKISNYSKDYNRKLIQRIYEKKEEKDVINILEKTVRDLWLVYINDDSEKEYPGFKTIKDDIQKFRKFKESESYIELYQMVAINFEKIFQLLKPRKQKRLKK